MKPSTSSPRRVFLSRQPRDKRWTASSTQLPPVSLVSLPHSPFLPWGGVKLTQEAASKTSDQLRNKSNFCHGVASPGTPCRGHGIARAVSGRGWAYNSPALPAELLLPKIKAQQSKCPFLHWEELLPPVRAPENLAGEDTPSRGRLGSSYLGLDTKVSACASTTCSKKRRHHRVVVLCQFPASVGSRREMKLSRKHHKLHPKRQNRYIEFVPLQRSCLGCYVPIELSPSVPCEAAAL